MVLGVVSRPGQRVRRRCAALIEGSHEPRARQLRHALRAIAIGRALIAAGIVERLDEPDETGRRYRLTMDLQLDFALDQPLSPLALAALDILDQRGGYLCAGCRVADRGDPGGPAAGAVARSGSRPAARRSRR